MAWEMADSARRVTTRAETHRYHCVHRFCISVGFVKTREVGGGDLASSQTLRTKLVFKICPSIGIENMSSDDCWYLPGYLDRIRIKRIIGLTTKFSFTFLNLNLFSNRTKYTIKIYQIN